MTQTGDNDDDDKKDESESDASSNYEQVIPQPESNDRNDHDRVIKIDEQ